MQYEFFISTNSFTTRWRSHGVLEIDKYNPSTLTYFSLLRFSFDSIPLYSFFKSAVDITASKQNLFYEFMLYCHILFSLSFRYVYKL